MRKIGKNEIQNSLRAIGFQTAEAFLQASTMNPDEKFRFFSALMHERVFPGGMVQPWNLFAPWKITRRNYTQRAWRQGGRHAVLKEIRQAALSELDDYADFDFMPLHPFIGSKGPYFARLLAFRDRQAYNMRLAALMADITLLERQMRNFTAETLNSTRVVFDYRIAFYDHAFEISLQKQSPFGFFNFQ
ncbi:MAG: hypothetical protein MJ240_08265 [Kiritimatiellae bacterium]|nr:hypothetical protein [Kiritimatiellia bacterium]